MPDLCMWLKIDMWTMVNIDGVEIKKCCWWNRPKVNDTNPWMCFTSYWSCSIWPGRPSLNCFTYSKDLKWETGQLGLHYPDATLENIFISSGLWTSLKVCRLFFNLCCLSATTTVIAFNTDSSWPPLYWNLLHRGPPAGTPLEPCSVTRKKFQLSTVVVWPNPLVLPRFCMK